MSGGTVCEHGHLARKCLHCEIVALEATNEELCAMVVSLSLDLAVEYGELDQRVISARTLLAKVRKGLGE